VEGGSIRGGAWIFKAAKLLNHLVYSESMAWDKEERMESLETKICEGEVDKEILPIVEKINSNPDYFTTSSCAGRIVLIEMPDLGDKEAAEFLGKWHREVEVEEVMAEFSRAKDNTTVFLLAQSPIIHIRCRTLESAVKLRNLAVESGLKYSTLKSLTLSSKKEPVKVMVEILSSENIHVPIARSGRLFPDRDYLAFLVENANQALKRAREKLVRFRANIA
jgi:tRNA wybutosine-synthesizing protein 3